MPKEGTDAPKGEWCDLSDERMRAAMVYWAEAEASSARWEEIKRASLRPAEEGAPPSMKLHMGEYYALRDYHMGEMGKKRAAARDCLRVQKEVENE